ncbi:MAG: asparagine synthase (glutamine-hydrolyzing) [Pseudomonadota bacterium]
MCGIAGEFSFTRPVEIRDIKLMIDAIAHRGPDDEGLFCKEKIGLGHRRLSIIDLSTAGHQPMWTSDKSLCIVFNGEIYNYKEIRLLLEDTGYRFTSHSDTEVVLNAVHCWGIENALRQFIGMFAFAVWNTRECCLILARDRAGIKPLFYSINKNSIIFGSELKALYAHPTYQKRLNLQGLGQFFVLGYTLGDTTVLNDTFRVPAGHFLSFGFDGSLKKRCYWSIDCIKRETFNGSFDDAAKEMERLSESAFAYRLISDVPVAVFLSGGIDSTFLSAILKKKIGADLLHITIGFRDKRYNEVPMATQIATELGLRHEVRYLDAPDAVNALRRFTDIYDEPFGDSSGMPTALLSAVAREYVKVALSADGGDEQFCGYESYPAYAKRYSQATQLPLPLRLVAAKIMTTLPYKNILSLSLKRQSNIRSNPRLISTFEKAISIMRAVLPVDILRIMNEKGWTEQNVGALIGANLSGLFADTVLTSRLLGNADANCMQIIDGMMRTDYQSFLRDDILTKVDRASMAVSLECRDPFLDHRLAEFAYSLPMNFVYSDGEHKHIIKHILRRWISDKIINAPKRGFVVPLYEWMHGPWKFLVQEYLSKERIRSVGVMDDAIVASEVDRFYRYQGIGAEKLFLLLNFQMWAERWYCS